MGRKSGCQAAFAGYVQPHKHFNVVMALLLLNGLLPARYVIIHSTFNNVTNRELFHPQGIANDTTALKNDDGLQEQWSSNFLAVLVIRNSAVILHYHVEADKQHHFEVVKPDPSQHQQQCEIDAHKRVSINA